MCLSVLRKGHSALTQLSSVPDQAFDWYDEYTHGDISHRVFMTRVSTLSADTTPMNLACPNGENTDYIADNDPDILTTYRTFSSPEGHGQGKGYWVSPRNIAEKRPAVIVLHEQGGLTPYIKNIARKLAKAGYIAFAPDALHSRGGYPGNEESGIKLTQALNQDSIVHDYMAAIDFVQAQDNTTGKVGLIGFGFGGELANTITTRAQANISAVISFNSTPEKIGNHEQIHVPLLFHFAEHDIQTQTKWLTYQGQLTQKAVPFNAYHYPKTHHGFHNTATPYFDNDASVLAWDRTYQFLREKLCDGN